jgi:pilus assembly protein CpaE
VAVVDADLQFGDVSIYCDLKQKKTIYDWIKKGYGRTHYSIDQFMEKHESGVSILAAPSRPEFFESIQGQHIEVALEEMKKIFDIVLIDTPAYLSEIHLSCVKKSDIVLLLAIKELSVLRNSRLYLDTLETLNLKDKVKFIINRDARNKTFDTKKIEEILGLKIETSLPDQIDVASSSIDNGIPFVISHSRTSIAKAVLSLAEQLSVHEKEALSRKKEEKPYPGS